MAITCLSPWQRKSSINRKATLFFWKKFCVRSSKAEDFALDNGKMDVYTAP